MSGGAVLPFSSNSTLPPPVIQGVASDLRNGRGNAGLILRVKAQQLCDLTCPLANQNDIVFKAELRRQNARNHGTWKRLAVRFVMEQSSSALPFAKLLWPPRR